MKGRVLSLENAFSFSQPKQKVLFKKFLVREFTTDVSGEPEQSLMEYSKRSGGLYLDSLTRVRETNLRRTGRMQSFLNGEPPQKVLYGNQLDHSSDLDLYSDYIETLRPKGGQKQAFADSRRKQRSSAKQASHFRVPGSKARLYSLGTEFQRLRNARIDRASCLSEKIYLERHLAG